MSAIANLLKVVRAYQSATGLGLSTVSWRVFGDTKKLAALEAGKDIQVMRMEKALQWLSDNWPTDAAWPRAIVRPAPARHEERAAS